MNPKLQKNQHQKPSISELTMNDLNRIKSQKQKEHHEDKKDLKLKSDSRVKNWPNTLEANRLRKENMKFERFKNEEVNIIKNNYCIFANKKFNLFFFFLNFSLINFYFFFNKILLYF